MHNPRFKDGNAPVDERSRDCADPYRALEEMFVDLVMGRRVDRGQVPVLRPVFLKQHGIVLGHFMRADGLADEYHVGVFAHERLPLVARFSSDTTPNQPDRKSTLGMAVKLLQVPGDKLLHRHASSCDFVLQNHHVFFVDNAHEMCAFIRAGVVQGDYSLYLNDHPNTVRILDEMAKEMASVLASSYWGLLPHRFGADRTVKFFVAPEHAISERPDVNRSIHNYLYLDLKSRLLTSEYRFGIYAQFRTDENSMPIDQATIAWEEAVSPPVLLGSLVFPAQNIDATGQRELGEALSFNIWQTLPEHEPLGSIAAARRVAYQSAAQLRREKNAIDTNEPESIPNPQGAMMSDFDIVRAEIHPAIGVARIGNSREEYRLSPEVVYPTPQPPGAYRDVTGAIKREAQRFRIYGYNAAGQVVKEITVDDAAIEWTVHVANKKAAWYNFTLAMDIEAVNDPEIEPARRRNSHIVGAERNKLVIDPGPRTILGRNTSGSSYHFDSGRFFDRQVYLGELRTDEAGRLIFLGGRGVSQSIYNAPPLDFANNDGWFDDISDGPVSAKVVMNGREIPVDSAWVVVAPPNYAPELKSVRTIYDLLEDMSGVVGTVSFTKHILPIFERMCGLQWVNEGFAAEFGWNAGSNFLDPDLLIRLSARKDTNGKSNNDELRRQVFHHFRNYESNNGWVGLWPWIYGDAMDVAGARERSATLGKLQYERLKKWADGDFESDYQPRNTPLGSLECVLVFDQPAMLTGAALSFCLADAFHPGCELTWAIRQSFSYRDQARFRFNERPVNVPEQDFGEILDPRVATSYNGPLRAFGPGDLTRWMAIPWQTDTASCRSGYRDNRMTLRLPSFWPARVPNHVLTKADYDIVMDHDKSLDERQAAFRNRRDWFLRIGRNYPEQLRRMVTEFSLLGIVERFPGPGDAEFPAEILVESFERPSDSDSGSSAESTTSMSSMTINAIDEPTSTSASLIQEFTSVGGTPDETIPKAVRYLKR